MKKIHILIFLLFLNSAFGNQSKIDTDLNEAEKTAFAQCVDSLPPHLREIYDKKIDRITFPDEFVSLAAFALTLNEKNKEFECIYHFKRSLLEHSLSEVLEEKIASYFLPSDAISLQVVTDFKLPAFAYILAHEMAHVFQFYYRIEDKPKENPYWLDYSNPFEKYDFPFRTKIRPYEDATLSASEIVSVYKQLADSPFVSLYASSSMLEDFAELMAFHYLLETRGNHLKIVVEKEKKSFEYIASENPLVIQRLLDLENKIETLPILDNSFDPFEKQKKMLRKEFEQNGGRYNSE